MSPRFFFLLLSSPFVFDTPPLFSDKTLSFSRRRGKIPSFKKSCFPQTDRKRQRREGETTVFPLSRAEAVFPCVVSEFFLPSSYVGRRLGFLDLFVGPPPLSSSLRRPPTPCLHFRRPRGKQSFFLPLPSFPLFHSPRHQPNKPALARSLLSLLFHAIVFFSRMQQFVHCRKKLSKKHSFKDLCRELL